MSKSKGMKGHPRYRVLPSPPSGFRSLPQGRGWECGQSHLDSISGKTVVLEAPAAFGEVKWRGHPSPRSFSSSLLWASMATSLRRQRLQEVEGWTGSYPSATSHDFIFLAVVSCLALRWAQPR